MREKKSNARLLPILAGFFVMGFGDIIVGVLVICIGYLFALGLFANACERGKRVGNECV